MVGGITLGSLFDGIGGFPLCATICGVNPIWAAEIEPGCVAITKQHFPNMLHYGDVSKISGAEIPPVDIITFGSPCQDLSVAGKRAGLDGARSGLFMEAIRIIYEMRIATNGKYPTFIVWENVPGAFNSHNGHDFRTVLAEITKTDIPMPTSGKWSTAGVVRGGAVCAAWRQLDAQYWGVPQRRKRIYLVGSFGSNCAEEILFKPDSVRRYLAKSGTQGQRITADTQTGVGSCNCYDARGNGGGQIAPTMTGDHFGRPNDYCAVVVQANGFHGQNSITAAGVEFREESAPTLTTKKNADVVYALQGSMIGREDKNGPQGDGINENICFTLNTTDRHCVVFNNSTFGGYTEGVGTLRSSQSKRPEENIVVDFWDLLQWIVRRLIPIECERVSGYPDNWTVLQRIDSMTEDEYEFFKCAYILDKEIKGYALKNVPNREQLKNWYNKLDCDGTRYKQLGNSLAIPCALRVIGYIAEYIEREREK